jgi:hypothetical protein
MRIDHLRKEALLWAIVQSSEQFADRLLNLGVELPEVHGDFYITVNGVPLCVAEYALSGGFGKSVCEHASLHRSVYYRTRLKEAFPGATVAIVAASCPTICSAMHTAA